MGTGILSTLFIILLMIFSSAQGQSIVPMLCVFGDSVVDVGNNNQLNTLIKANFPPYGRDFVTHSPTGRFCNGKLATDFTAEYLGFTSYPPPYLSKEVKAQNLLTGVNFASAGSGYFMRQRAISLTQQLAYYKEYQDKLVKMTGTAKAKDLFSGGIHLVSAGSSDYIQNYYINPMLNRRSTSDQFSDILITAFSNFVQNLYNLGVRKIGVTSLPPFGCLPAAITLFGGGSNQCVPKLNQDADSFNYKLNGTSQNIQSKLPGLKLVMFDIYHPLLDMVRRPSDNGFFESRRACCGTGTVETSVLCNARSIWTCSNATQYVFWDGFYPSEAANQVLAQTLLEQGVALITLSIGFLPKLFKNPLRFTFC